MSEIVDIARAFLGGSVGVVQIARRINALSYELGLEGDELFRLFNSIDSETDAFPLGLARDQWRAEALLREDAARQIYEDRVRGVTRAACVELIERYGAITRGDGVASEL